jgi:DNA polymerase I
MSNDKTYYLIDAYAIIFRAYYALIRTPRFNSKGLNTSAIFGFVNSLEDILQNRNPSHIAVAFDPPYPTFRHKLFREYKANRDSTPEDIKKSVPFIKSIVSAYHIPILEVPGYEADDVIGTLAKKAESAGFTVYMVTPDKDYCQLVDTNILIYKPKKAGNESEIWDKNTVITNYQIKDPLQIIDLLALMGDTADNIPGAPGVGEVTAKKLLSQFDSIEDLFANVHEVKGKLQQIICDNVEKIRLSKELATICLDVPIDLNVEPYLRETMDEVALKSIFKDLEFKSISERIFRTSFQDRPSEQFPVQKSLFDVDIPVFTSTIQDNSLKNIYTVHHNYKLVSSPENVTYLLDLLNNSKEFCFDTETTGLDPYQDDIIGISFAVKPHEAFYLPLPNLREKAISFLAPFKDVFMNGSILKIGQNCKFDILMLKKYQIKVVGPFFDTMLAHYLIQPELRHNMDFLSEVYLNYKPVSIEELIGPKGKGQLNMKMIEVDKVKEYSGEDADVTLQLKQILIEELKNKGLLSLSGSIEMPLLEVLADMEWTGIKLQVDALNDYEVIINQRCQALENEIFTLAGETFNISSPKQLGIILFEKLKIIDDAKKTKTQQYSTNEEVIEKLKDRHPIINIILEYRGLKKLSSTYIEALPRLINPLTGRVHTSFNQAVTSTGRLSSTNPNLQNIPVRDAEGREIRKAFIPGVEGNVLISADYSQIELRIMAHMSGDPNMIEAFSNMEDIHVATAAKIYGVPHNEVTKVMRSKAKTANFGIIYGISAYGLSQRLNIPRGEAKELIDGYFKTYPGVNNYIEESIAKAKRLGYVETLLGRRRYVPDINSGNAVVRGFAERNAVNAPIQGSAADIIKIAMIRIFTALEENHFKTKMILQVHDELIFDTYPNELDRIKDLVRVEMESAFKLKVPLIADVGVGKNWLEAH